MKDVPLRYLVIGVLVLLCLPAGWYFYPRDPLHQGRVLMRGGNYTAALTVWRNACARSTPHIESCAAAVATLLSRGENEEARSLFERAKKHEPEHLRVLMLEGSFLEMEGKTPEAKAVYERAERTYPNSGLPAANLARLAMASNDLAEAERCAERAIAADPSLGIAHATKARVLVLSSSLDPAIDLYFKALELDPVQTNICLELGDVLERKARGSSPEEAENFLTTRADMLRVCTEMDPSNPALLVPYALTRLETGDVDAAVESLRTACENDPRRVDARVYLCYAHQLRGDWVWAVARCEEAQKLDPTDPQPKHLLAVANGHMKDYDKALAIWAEVLADPKTDKGMRARVLGGRAFMNIERGRPEEALADLDTILATDPKSPDALYMKAHVFVNQQKPDDAVPLLHAVEAQGVANCDVVFDLMRAYAQKEQRENTVAYAKALVARECEFDDVLVKKHTEFRFLERDEEFRLLLEAKPHGPADPAGPDLGP